MHDFQVALFAKFTKRFDGFSISSFRLFSRAAASFSRAALKLLMLITTPTTTLTTPASSEIILTMGSMSVIIMFSLFFQMLPFAALYVFHSAPDWALGRENRKRDQQAKQNFLFSCYSRV